LTAFSAAEIDAFREAGRISAEAREWAAGQVKPGVLARRVQEDVEALIRDRGALPSFPAQTSLNDVAAHYCSSPTDHTRFSEGDLVKVDVGAHVDGYPADTGVTVDLSADARWTGLIKAAADALDAAVAMLAGKVRAGGIGSVIEQTIRAAGFRPIANLSGHGLARWSLHAPPQIPNIAMAGGPVIGEGLVFAIEPFTTTGVGFVRESGVAEVFSQSGELARSGDADDSCVERIEAWRGLPFARRYFSDAPPARFERCLKGLVRSGMVHAYRPLVEISGGHVAWKEHTIYLGEFGPEILTQSP
jgi:methionyl aminopeptidase